MLVYGFLDNLYMSEDSLTLCEGVTSEEAEVFALDTLPAYAARIDGGELIPDLFVALKNFSADDGRMVVWKYWPEISMYRIFAVMESPAFLAYQRAIGDVTR